MNNETIEVAAAVEGTCAPEFETVRDVFTDNFRRRGEIGAAVCVYKDGKKVVDFWAATRTSPELCRGRKTPSSS